MVLKQTIAGAEQHIIGINSSSPETQLWVAYSQVRSVWIWCCNSLGQGNLQLLDLETLRAGAQDLECRIGPGQRQLFYLHCLVVLLDRNEIRSATKLPPPPPRKALSTTIPPFEHLLPLNSKTCTTGPHGKVTPNVPDTPKTMGAHQNKFYNTLKRNSGSCEPYIHPSVRSDPEAQVPKYNGFRSPKPIRLQHVGPKATFLEYLHLETLGVSRYPYISLKHKFINPFPKTQVFGYLHHLGQLSSKGIQAFLLHRSGACLCAVRVAPAPATHLGNNAEEARITLGIQTAQCR